MKDIMFQFEKYIDLAPSHKPLYLPSIMPSMIKEEINRLRRVLDENAPDNIHYFEAEPCGLDFSFDKPESKY